ncbi:MAG: ThiF family adenylyltransferase [Gemmataceae bacterium]
MNLPSDRAIRQRDLVPPIQLARAHALVIGVGAIGRQVALQLATLGVSRMTLFDGDSVGVENLAAQGYWPEDIAQAKVTVTAKLCAQIHADMELTAIPERFRRSSARSFQEQRDVALFLCVDSIATRRLIWDSIRPWARLVVDGRMNAEVIRVLAADAPVLDTQYAGTLFDASEAYVGACTGRSTIYAASIAAGLMVAQFARHLRNVPVITDQTLNLLTAELSVA